MINVNKEIISFKEIPSLSESACKTVLLLRHSYRESLQNGNLDPGLTAEGWEYAVACGKLLKGMKNVCFGASPRKRTIQTVQALIEGGELCGEEPLIATFPQLHDTAMFSPPEMLGVSVADKTLSQLLRTYYTTGNAPSMIALKDFANDLADFLAGTEFGAKNVILATHDILLVALLSFFRVYPFHEEDWCGYVQGACLYSDKNGQWTISYTVPDKEMRKECKLFV
ncbi:MAG: phosphoglycerate mutase family protein [Lentisphaeria bacterium]|nr:phosphoglycerate mutase family protein [Lentisphaeria bacterium]